MQSNSLVSLARHERHPLYAYKVRHFSLLAKRLARWKSDSKTTRFVSVERDVKLRLSLNSATAVSSRGSSRGCYDENAAVELKLQQGSPSSSATLTRPRDAKLDPSVSNLVIGRCLRPGRRRPRMRIARRCRTVYRQRAGRRRRRRGRRRDGARESRQISATNDTRALISQRRRSVVVVVVCGRSWLAVRRDGRYHRRPAGRRDLDAGSLSARQHVAPATDRQRLAWIPPTSDENKSTVRLCTG